MKHSGMTDEIKFLLNDKGIHIFALNETKLDGSTPKELTENLGYQQLQCFYCILLCFREAKFSCDRAYLWPIFYATGCRVWRGFPHTPSLPQSSAPPPGSEPLRETFKSSIKTRKNFALFMLDSNIICLLSHVLSLWEYMYVNYLANNIDPKISSSEENKT